MVYCGKPSKGCDNCRAKRVKCDQKRPACSQCIKTGRTCLGYRNTTDLLFRDESARVKAKAQNGGKALSPCRDLAKRSPKRERTSPPAEPPVYMALEQPLEDTAVHFLLGHYLLGGHFDYLPNLYSGTPHDLTLSTIVKAVALASLSIQTNRPELQVSARKLYVQAIANTNFVLQDEITATRDEVLASILLLSLYETLTVGSGVSSEATQAYTTHMQGVASVVMLRGESQFASPFGIELFMQCAMSVAYCCIQDGTRFPDGLRRLAIVAETICDDPSMGIPNLHLVDAFCDLHADLYEGLLTDSRIIISRAEGLLETLESLASNIPNGFRYETCYLNTPSEAVYGDYYYTFGDHHVAKRWNTNWMAQLLLHGLICSHLLSSHSDSGIESATISYPMWLEDPCPSPMADSYLQVMYQARQRAMRELLDDICATVPHFFPPDDSAATKALPSPAAGYFLVWPLYCVGVHPLATNDMKNFAHRRLKHIGKVLHLPQAVLAADMLAQAKEDRDTQFMHACHVF